MQFQVDDAASYCNDAKELHQLTLLILPHGTLINYSKIQYE